MPLIPVADLETETAMVRKALAGQSSRAEISAMITKFAAAEQLDGESIESAESRFLQSESGSLLYSAYEKAPVQAPPAVVEKKAVEVPITKAQKKLHDMANNLVADSKGKLSYHRAYAMAGEQHPDLFQQAIDGEPDADDQDDQVAA